METPTGDAGPRLDRARRVEHPRSLDRGAGREAGGRLRRLQPPRPQLQRSDRRCRAARGAPRPRVHAPPESGSRSVSHVVLRRALGLLHEPEAARRARAGTTTSSSTRRSDRARPPTARRWSPAAPRTRSSSRRTRVIRRSRTTISPASPSSPSSRARSRRRSGPVTPTASSGLRARSAPSAGSRGIARRLTGSRTASSCPASATPGHLHTSGAGAETPVDRQGGGERPRAASRQPR